MKETGARFVITDGIDPEELAAVPVHGITLTGKRTYNRKPKDHTPFVPAVSSLYGVTITPMMGLGQHGKPDSQLFWKEVLGALQIGHGFLCPKSKMKAAPDATRRYTRDSKKIWKQYRKFIYEKNRDEKGNPSPGNARVGRIA